MNGFTDAPLIRPDHTTWNVTWTVLFQIRSFSGRFIFLHLSTSPRSDFPGSHGVKKHEGTCFVLNARTTKFWYFLCFLSWHMETLQWARNVWRVSSQMSQDGTCFSYWAFLYLLSLVRIFLLFVCFDKLWQLTMIHAHDNTCDRDVNTLRQNDVTWCYFLQGKQVELSLSCSLSPQKT